MAPADQYGTWVRKDYAMKKKELIGRWESDPEWIDRRKEIQSALVSTKGQSEYVNVDLRGITIAETDRHCPWIKAKVLLLLIRLNYLV